jgi:Response regulator of the LytR/AlgR family
MRCIAIDDEPPALKQICSYIEKAPFLELLGSSNKAAEGLAMINELLPDLIFVDINMPGINGVDLVKSLKVKCMVIFTTAYSEYAIDGFRVDATDYLLKPISYTDFLRSAEKALRLYELVSEKSVIKQDTDSLFVRSEHKMIRIEFADIIYIESRSEYMYIRSETDRPVMTLGSMTALTDRLPADRFMRVHRTYIVNMQKIKFIERKRIFMQGDHVIPIGEKYRDAFYQRLGLIDN